MKSKKYMSALAKAQTKVKNERNGYFYTDCLIGNYGVTAN